MAERVAEVLHVHPEGKLSNLFVELASQRRVLSLWLNLMSDNDGS